MNSQENLTRRTLLGGAVGVAGLTALAACSSGSRPTSTSTGTAAAPVISGVLNVWGGVPPETGPNDLITAFQAKYPTVKVVYTRYVNDATGQLKLDSSLQGGVPIDLFFTYDGAALSKRVAAGLAVDVTKRVAADSDLKVFSADSDPVKNMVFNRKIYTVPAAVSPQITLVNDALLKKSGITIPSNWDFAEYEHAAKELSTKGSVFGAFAAPLIARTTLGPNANYKNKGKASNFADPAWQKQINANVALQKSGYSVPQEQVLAQQLKTFTQTPFLSGQVAMLNTQPFILRYANDTSQYPHDFKIRCLPSPIVNTKSAGWNPGAYGDLISISAKSKNQDAAWTFLKFWVLNAGKYMTPGGRLPSLAGTSKPADVVAGLLGPNRDKLYDVDSFEKVLFSTQTQKIPVDTIFTAASQIATAQDKVTDQVLLGDITTKEWVQQLTQQADAAIKAAA